MDHFNYFIYLYHNYILDFFFNSITNYYSIKIHQNLHHMNYPFTFISLHIQFPYLFMVVSFFSFILVIYQFFIIFQVIKFFIFKHTQNFSSNILY